MEKIKTSYKSTADRQPGAKWTSNNYGEIEIIGKVDDGTGRNYKVRFLDTGTELIVNGSRFKTGDFKDPMAKIVCGVACIGIGIYDGVNYKKEKTLWHNMLDRCYKPTIYQKCYEDVSICERWLNFQNFCEDLEEIPGYKEWKQANNYALDKDGIKIGNKCYCKEYCQFIYCGDNTILSNTSKSIYEATDPNNNKFYFRNQRLFADKHNLNRRGISSVVSGDQKTHKNWKFRRLTEKEIITINQELIQD